MRKPIVAGNWKMYKTRDEALQFIYNVNDLVPSSDHVETLIFAPAILLRCVVKRQGENLKIGAQNMHYAEEGAFTGEISPEMLVSTGIHYCLIGHTERRIYNGETERDVNLKIKSALKHNIVPCVCFGETKEQFEHADTDIILKEQVRSAFKGVDKSDISKIIIAYEPIWAIGAKSSAPSSLADSKCELIRNIIQKLYSKETADQIRILYGGSVSPDNFKELIRKPNIDGALIGRSSLDADSFVQMCNDCLEYVNEEKNKEV